MSSNTLYTGDNLHFLNRMNTESVDLIYLDPPFNSKRIYSAPVGSKAAGASFKDMWTWQDVDEVLLENLITKYSCLVGFIRSIEGTHSKPMMSYITYMAQRIIELHRVLKDTGSLYIHIDTTASHYLKIICDKIFGHDHFQNEIVWWYDTGGMAKKKWSRKHDILLFYSKSKDFTFNVRDVMDEKNKSQKERFEMSKKRGNDSTYRLTSDKKFPHDVWKIHAINPKAKERTGYPTQKPLELLCRIIKASSNDGDVVLDPFCGCATTCVSAQQNNRRWIGIDIEEGSAKVLVGRLSDDAGMFRDFIHTHELPERTDLTFEAPSNSMKDEMFGKQKGACNGCGITFPIQNLEIDHIIPKSKGGSDTRRNYQLLCGSCNRTKGNRPMEYLRTKIKLRDVFLSQQITFDK